MSTRTSARLVKAKGKRVTTGMDETQDNLGDDGNFEQVESEKEDQPPPRKRQRAATKSTTGVARKKQVRGKQGRLAGLITMPIDIFTEVASHLLPVDIISLARLNKFFRNLLMHRSAIHIWHGAMRNVKGLPPCPPGMSEPHYLALLFSKTCSMCGAAARARMDHVLFVRLCGSCRNAELMPLETVPMVIMPLVHRSTSTAPVKRRSAGEFVLRAEFNDVLAQFQEKKRSGDSNALEAWIKERIENVEKRRTHSQELIRFLISLECERDQELNDAKTARRLEINRRLGELGWTDKDMEFGWWSSKQRAWADLVSQPKPLTERIWSNIRPKLIPLLEINREERLEMERGTRKRSRRVRLSELIRGLKDQVSPTLAFKIKHPLYSFAERGNTAHLQAPFPDFVYALDWPLVKNLYETDTTVEEMEASFEAHRNEIAALISEWKNRIQSQLANLVREGQELQGAIPEPANIISDDDSDPFASMSDDLKLLLRADTLFSRTTSLYSLKQPSTYGTILFSEDLVGSVNPISLWSTVPRDPLSLDHIRLHPEAREVARALLADMGKPNASYLEMQGIGLDLVCGRCHMGGPRTWEQLILHYLQQNQVYESVQKSASNSSDPGIEYKNVHDPALYPDRPMVQYYSAHDSDDNEELEDEMSGVQVCKLCAKIPAADGVAAHKSAVLRHIRDVHGIAEPKIGEHYSPRMTSITDMFGLGMDAYDSDDSYGCDCPFHQMFGGGSDYGSGYGYGYDDEDEYEEEYDDDYGWW